MKKGKGIFTKRVLGNMAVVAFGVLLYLGLSNFTAIRTFAGWFFSILSPFVIGIGIAYLLNMPMRFFESKVYKNLKAKRALSMLTVYLLFGALFVILVVQVIPQLGQSVAQLINNIPMYLNGINELTAWATETFDLEPDTLNFVRVSVEDLFTQFQTWVVSVWPQIVAYIVQVGSGIISTLTAFIASIYMLASKDKLLLQTRRVLYALLPERLAKGVYRVGNLSNQMFSGFISGKLLDSAIIGVICYVFMFVMNTFVYEMPYGLLISIVIGVTNIIPFFGPFIGGIPCCLILLLVNPWSALWFGIFIIVLQQVDGNVIGPVILGDSTGLPGLWVLISIVVGGGWFGFAGMLLGVPTAAVLYALSSDIVANRLNAKGLDRHAAPVAASAKPNPLERDTQEEEPQTN